MKAVVLPVEFKSRVIASLFSPGYRAKEQLADLILSMEASSALHVAVGNILQQNAAGTKLHTLSQAIGTTHPFGR